MTVEPLPHERGAALLTVLLIVAVVGALAAAGLERLNLSIRLAGNATATAQARAYAIASEDIALLRLDAVLAQAKGQLALTNELNGQSYDVPLPGGGARATVSDGGNCFNLNSLVIRVSPDVYAANFATIPEFARLIRLVGEPAQVADGVAAATTDWIDSDTTPLPGVGGAEDEAYASRTPAYRTANTLMADASELRAVLGVTPELYAKLRPWVCALPVAEPTQLNINTLTPEQAPLVAMLYPDTMSVEQARALLLARPAQGFASAQAFLAQPALSGVTAGPSAAARTTTTTRWFRLAVRVHLPGGDFTQTSIIDARQAPARLVQRRWGDDA